MYDLIIVGGGPGGVAAGVYAARKKIKTLFITDSFGGQSLVSADVQNWVGTKSVSGFDLGVMLEEHLRAQEDIEIIGDDLVTNVTKTPAGGPGQGGGFSVTTQNGKTFETKYLFIASGSRRKKLNIPGEKELDGKGVVYCSTCDAPLFKNKAVAVVGGGNAGLEAVVDLLPYASEIYLLQYGDALKGDAVTQEKIKSNPKVKVLTMAMSKEIVGEGTVRAIRYEDRKTGEAKELAVQGVFVEIGALPNSDIVKEFVTLNMMGEIVVDHKTQQTSDPGIWAVGDVSDVRYKQNNISAGDAVKAVLNIYERLMK
jgi:NADH-dependent peroxiredoxin subunit F